jgi:HAD superfamily hydrolase (TIGR01548 family)
MKKSSGIQAVLFDIDNVLVDTRHSYFDSIRWAIEIYLTHGKVPFFEKAHQTSTPTILTHHDVEQFKLLGGFNDDWDCCYGLLIYLLSLHVKGRKISDLKHAMNIPAFAKKVKIRPLRVPGIVQMIGSSKAVTIEKISRIFQEVYLGKDLFEALEKRRAFYWKKRGLIHKEKLIFKKVLFDKLKAMGIKLGIATGRPRFEAHYVLKRFHLFDYFDAITTINEVKMAERERKESLRKPHPFSLIESAKKMGAERKYLYIGDLPDDILAAKRAKSEIDICSAAFPWYAANPKAALEEIQKNQPDYVLDKPNDLLKIVAGA